MRDPESAISVQKETFNKLVTAANTMQFLNSNRHRHKPNEPAFVRIRSQVAESGTVRIDPHTIEAYGKIIVRLYDDVQRAEPAYDLRTLEPLPQAPADPELKQQAVDLLKRASTQPPPTGRDPDGYPREP